MKLSVTLLFIHCNKRVHEDRLRKIGAQDGLNTTYHIFIDSKTGAIYARAWDNDEWFTADTKIGSNPKEDLCLIL